MFGGNRRDQNPNWNSAKRGHQTNRRRNEIPEWFSDGPTSRYDTIELSGLGGPELAEVTYVGDGRHYTLHRKLMLIDADGVPLYADDPGNVVDVRQQPAQEQQAQYMPQYVFPSIASEMGAANCNKPMLDFDAPAAGGQGYVYRVEELEALLRTSHQEPWPPQPSQEQMELFERRFPGFLPDMQWSLAAQQPPAELQQQVPLQPEVIRQPPIGTGRQQIPRAGGDAFVQMQQQHSPLDQEIQQPPIGQPIAREECAGRSIFSAETVMFYDDRLVDVAGEGNIYTVEEVETRMRGAVGGWSPQPEAVQQDAKAFEQLLTKMNDPLPLPQQASPAGLVPATSASETLKLPDPETLLHGLRTGQLTTIELLQQFILPTLKFSHRLLIGVLQFDSTASGQLVQQCERQPMPASPVEQHQPITSNAHLAFTPTAMLRHLTAIRKKAAPASSEQQAALVDNATTIGDMLQQLTVKLNQQQDGGPPDAQQVQQMPNECSRNARTLIPFDQQEPPNPLAKWFSPELLALASAGKLPSLDIGQAIRVEELERSILSVRTGRYFV